MSTPSQAPAICRFGVFEINVQSGELRKNGIRLRLSGQPFQVLAILLERAGAVVSREDLHARLWAADTFVDFDHGLNNAIARIREVLDDSSGTPRYVETIPKRGYRFIGPVDWRLAAVPQLDATPLEISPTPAPATEKMASHTRLPRVLVATTVVAIIAVGFVAYRSITARKTNESPIKSLAVLPLTNLSGDRAQDYLADGMTEELIGRLSGIRDLRVTSHTSVLRFKDTQLPLSEIASTLKVDAIVEGSVMREGSRVRVHAQLIRATTDQHIWSETYDRELRSVLSLESDVAQAIAEKVKVTISGEERSRLLASRDVSPEVYESYLHGLALKRDNRADVEESVRYFEQAIKADPTFAPAYVGLADAYDILGSIFVGAAPSEFRPKVIEAARKALELDPELAKAHVVLANVYHKELLWNDAQNEVKMALDLRPNDAGAHILFAELLLSKGQFDEAIAWAKRGRQLDPVAVSGAELAWILFQARRYDEAERELRAELAVQPEESVALWHLGFVLIAEQRAAEAIPVLEKTLSVSHGSPGVMGVLIRAYSQAGRRSDALRLLNELKQRRTKGYVPAGAFIQAYVGLGDNDQAFAWLNRGYEERSAIMQWLKVEPTFDPLRHDPRFIELIHRVGLQ
ncbi:MAG TPA: tetratricopeptide repeat protein [Terracidiphilus sp.]|jgi:TolB-like protein/DNA-binding winged helix-turn-helix (wHTH) protein/cytochrome c-type biogenesis protein CcmH/NrfG